MPQWVSWDRTGAVGSKSGHEQVKTGSNVGHIGHLGHVEGSVSQVSPMGHVGHWAREFMQNGFWGYWILPCGSNGLQPIIMVARSLDLIRSRTMVPQRIQSLCYKVVSLK